MARLFKHHKKGDYGRFQDGSGTLLNYPFIVELVFNDNPNETKVWTNIKLDVESNKFDETENEYYHNQYGFFTRIIVYNSSQCTGNVAVDLKDVEATSNFFEEMTIDESGHITAIKREGNWLVNGFRSNVVNTTKPFFTKEWNKLKLEFPIDKVINGDTIDFNKPWNELEMFRGKFLISRFIDDNRDNSKQLIVKLVDDNMVKSSR